MMEELFGFWLAGIPGIGAAKIERMLQYFGSPEEIFKAGIEHFSAVKNLRQRDVESIVKSRNPEVIQRNYDKMKTDGISFQSSLEEGYPERLRSIYQPPFGLFYKGSLPSDNQKMVAVVGGRDASYEAKEIAKQFGRQLAENGIGVVSGLARGVDVSAHQGVFTIAAGKTYGVLGNGVDICYPRQHIESYMVMQEYGGVISEFAPGTPPVAGNFPMRNRIISGLSDGILVIEAREKSGSLITAEQGLEQGKDVFVVPGDITNPAFFGSNRLIKNGAALVTCVADILDGLGIFLDEDVSSQKKKCEVMLETTEKIVYSYLSLEPIHLSDIAKISGIRVQKVMEILISMEIKGVVRDIGNHYYALSSFERMESKWQKIW